MDTITKESLLAELDNYPQRYRDNCYIQPDCYTKTELSVMYKYRSPEGFRKKLHEKHPDLLLKMMLLGFEYCNRSSRRLPYAAVKLIFIGLEPPIRTPEIENYLKKRRM